MKLIFRKTTNTRLSSLLIAWYTSPFKWKFNNKWRNTYTHTEILFSDGVMFSASQYENITRFVKFTSDQQHWDMFELPDTLDEETVRLWCYKQRNQKYDYLGVLGFVLPFNLENPSKWFCSEINCASLQTVGYLTHLTPSRVTPNELAFEIGLLKKD